MTFTLGSKIELYKVLFGSQDVWPALRENKAEDRVSIKRRGLFIRSYTLQFQWLHFLPTLVKPFLNNRTVKT